MQKIWRGPVKKIYMQPPSTHRPRLEDRTRKRTKKRRESGGGKERRKGSERSSVRWLTVVAGLLLSIPWRGPNQRRPPPPSADFFSFYKRRGRHQSAEEEEGDGNNLEQ